jgi:hypothetical protein
VFVIVDIGDIDLVDAVGGVVAVEFGEGAESKTAKTVDLAESCGFYAGELSRPAQSLDDNRSDPA